MRIRTPEDLPPGPLREQARAAMVAFSESIEIPPRGAPQDIVRALPDIVARRSSGLAAGATKPRKYRNVRVYLEGQWFDSRLEYDLWCVLHARMKAGEIAYIKRQATFVLEGGVRYRADYECVLTLPYAIKAGACSEVWDAKGRDTQASQNKRKQVKARYGVDVRLWTKADRKRGAA